MSTLDLIVLFGTLAFIVGYGSWKTRKSSNIEGYLLGGKSMKWGTIGLSVMATQASAITFLSTPGQAYEDGMRFVQNYLGQPIALIIICAVFIPIYYKLKVYTAYEFLETRFDLKTRLLGAFLFLIQRGLQAGITIYAPAIIISSILGWNLSVTILMVGILVIIYTVAGGTKAVSLTQKYQMAIIMIGMFVAFGLIIYYLPEKVSFFDSIRVAGKMGKMNVIDFSFDFSKRYTFWSGITGGLLMGMSYFGTDQSQVQRYISGKNTTESRMGLMFNAVLKVPMQFFILLTGVMVFMFYQFEQPPVYFKSTAVTNVLNKEYPEEFAALEKEYAENFHEKENSIYNLIQEFRNDDSNAIDAASEKVLSKYQESREIRSEVKELLTRHDPDYETKDSDFVFLTFIMNYLPHGIIGLLIAVIFSAAMSSTSGELNALGSTTTVDFYKRIIKKNGSDKHYLVMSRVLTALWGFIAIYFAFIAQQSENLIEAVNIVGSVFYGTILGIFLVAFLIKNINGTSIFYSALLAEAVVIVLHILTVLKIIHIGYLWYNVIGCLLTILLAIILQKMIKNFSFKSLSG